MKHPYAELLTLPYPIPLSRPRMSMQERAAQFSPFAALSGYEAAIQEAGRITQPRAVLDESERSRLDRKLQWLRAHLPQRPRVRVTYFLPDPKKSGGRYETVTARALAFDLAARTLLLEGGTQVPIDEIFHISVDSSPQNAR